MYVAQLANGRKVRRHIDQLRERWANSSLELSPIPDTVPNKLPEPPVKEECATEPRIGQEPEQTRTPEPSSSVTDTLDSLASESARPPNLLLLQSHQSKDLCEGLKA
ncbi:UNVERIFIED_CONTAM: hypothetical protein K2H54_046303, partial [Gekko kuhli]